MVFSIIQNTELEGALRLDADYYEPRFLNLKKVLENIKTTKLSEISTISTGPAYGGELMGSDFEIPLARIGDVTKKTDINSWIRLSADEFKKYNSKRILDNEILMTMTGDPPDVGKCNIVNTEGTNLAFNQRVAKITSRKHLVLFAYLSTEYARTQSERNSLGIRQRNVGIGDIRNIQIPMFGTAVAKEIKKSVSQYLLLRKKSKVFIEQAEELLLGELGIKDSDLVDRLTFETNIDEIEIAQRLDAEYFRPSLKLGGSIKSRNLGDLVSIKKGIEPGSGFYQEEGVPFVRVSNVSKDGLKLGGVKHITEDSYNALTSFKPEKNEILLTKDATPGIACVFNEPIKCVVSSGILRLRVTKEVIPEYLVLCINSKIGQCQIIRDSGGSIISHWKPKQVRFMEIPILPLKTQQKIAKLVKESHLARKKSTEMLEKAKKTVEEYIEKG